MKSMCKVMNPKMDCKGVLNCYVRVYQVRGEHILRWVQANVELNVEASNGDGDEQEQEMESIDCEESLWEEEDFKDS